MAWIDDAITEALDAVGDEAAYASARASLEAARDALRVGTTAEAHTHLNQALQALEEACPI